MKTKIVQFLSSLRVKIFVLYRNWEIFNRLMAQLNGEKKCGYPFNTADQMKAITRADDAQALLQLLESQVQQMPRGYGEAFRYLLHRDVSAQIKMYLHVAQKRIPRAARLPEYS